MALKFIFGKPGTGKTTLCLREIVARLDSTAPLYYLVPEQFSLQSERLLLDFLANQSPNRTAATQVQVLSFNRLAYRLFATVGGVPGKMADDLGKQMLLRKVLFEVADRLTYYKSAADKHGFVDSLLNTITEMNQYRVSATDLMQRAITDSEASPAMAAKLADIAEIANAYRQLVDGKYLLTDDMLEILCAKLYDMQNDPLPLLDGAYFWVDGFSGFTPQERLVLMYLAQRAKNVTVTLTTDLQSPNLSPPIITMGRLEKLARETGVVIEEHIQLDENFRHVKNGDLAFFVDNFTMLRMGKDLTSNIAAPLGASLSPDYADSRLQSDSAIKIISAPDRYAAVNTAASHIQQLVRHGNYRFRDIAILCGDRAKYEKVLQTTFDRLNIPLFVDTETDILSHPLTELIRAVLDIVVRNWSYEPVFRFLKTQMTGLPQQIVDVLENYVLEYGISSYRWRYPFSNPVAENAREQLHIILSDYTKSTNQSSDTVRNHSKRIFALLYSLDVPSNLQLWFDKATAAGDHNTARMHRQIWPKICEIFDKLVEMLGDEYVSIKDFAEILDAGFAQVGLGRIPPTTDQVVLGDIGRSRYPQIKAMIVLGANENSLPANPVQSGLFTDHERKTLRNTGVHLAAETMERVAESYYSLYLALSQPTEKLTVIYSEAETNGKPLRPSPIIPRLLQMFPAVQTEQALQISEYGNFLPPEQSKSLLSEKSIQDLYGDNLTTAASRLESFARCPFAYFMDYILQAKPRKRFEVLPTDLGNLFHDVLAEFTKKVWQAQGDEFTLSREEISHYVEEIIGILTQESNLYNDTARNRHILDKVQKVSTASIWALNEQINLGGFVPTLTEEKIVDIGGILLDNGKTLTLTGIVDRVDTLNVQNEEYIKIIDYKSGSTKFNIDEVRQGIQLQLMIYMNVLTKVRNAKPGGVFYFPVDDPLLLTDIMLDDETREAELLKQFKMSGVALAENEVIAGLDKTLAPGVTSKVIPVALNKDGRFKKSTQPATLALEEFTALGHEVDAKIKELGERLTGGDISAVPYEMGARSPCNYCSFDAICGRKK